MFFMIGVTPDVREIPVDQVEICPECGSYGRYRVRITSNALSLFFIPVFRFGKNYQVVTTCCNTVYALDPEIGRCLERGEAIRLRPEHMQKIQNGYRSKEKECPSCGYRTREAFEFCPHCGQRLNGAEH